MFIFVSRWVAMRGLRPRPVKVEESVSGALLGLLDTFGADSVCFCSTFGLDVKSEDIIWPGWRGFGFTCATDCDAIDGRLVSFRSRLDGRSSTFMMLTFV